MTFVKLFVVLDVVEKFEENLQIEIYNLIGLGGYV